MLNTKTDSFAQHGRRDLSQATLLFFFVSDAGRALSAPGQHPLRRAVLPDKKTRQHKAQHETLECSASGCRCFREQGREKVLRLPSLVQDIHNSPTSDGSECMAPELHSSRRFAKEGTRALLKMGIQARSVGTLQSPSQAK